jgi:hypothetical protein
MQLARPAFAVALSRTSPGRAARVDPRVFGRGRILVVSMPAMAPSISADLKLFATTFLAGFVFVSVLIA